MSLENNIKDWLEKGGFPFEFECAKAFNKHGFNITQGMHYYDKEINTPREIDISAYKQFHTGSFAFNVTFLVECKSLNKPWIVFMTDKTIHNDAFVEGLIMTRNGGQMRAALQNKSNDTFTFTMKGVEEMAYNIVEMESNKKDHAYEATMQSHKACLSLLNDANNSRTSFCNIYIPVVITSHQLYKVSPITKHDSAEDPYNLEKIEFAKIVQSKAFEYPRTLHAVSAEGLENYLLQISNDIEVFFENYKDDICHISTNYPINSQVGKY